MLQAEKAECGLACIAMVAGFHGRQFDIVTLRKYVSLSNRGLTASALTRAAGSIHLTSRILKVPLARLSEVKLPCVLHWDFAHFVVLTDLQDGQASILDPAVGRRRLPLFEFSNHFTGVVVELAPSESFSIGDSRARWSPTSLLHKIPGLSTALAKILFLGLGLQILLLLVPMLLQGVVDGVSHSRGASFLSLLALVFLSAAVLQGALVYARGLTVAGFTTLVSFHWLNEAFARLCRLPLSYFERRHLGDVVNRFGSIESIQKVITTTFVECVVDGLFMLVALAVMVHHSLAMTGIAVTGVVAYAAVLALMNDRLRVAAAEQLAHEGSQRMHLLEAANGAQAVRLFNRSSELQSIWSNRLVDQLNAGQTAQQINTRQKAITTLALGLERVFVIWWGATLVISNLMSLGVLMAFIAYRDQFSARMTALIDKFFELKVLSIHNERLADMFLTEIEPEQRDESFWQGDSVSIECRDLRFRYSENDPWVLNGLNLRINSGESLAIAGPSGCGKSTLVKLLLGLLNPTSGEIVVNGHLLTAENAASYRDQVSAVMQEDHLFSGSVAQNISFYDSNAELAAIEHAASLAGIHEEIIRLPMGYHTLIGAVGSGLSGGQKQRILLARALYRRPKMLVLDEATSHLDVSNERIVNRAIGAMKFTRIIVAHRPETIASADRVVTLKAGNVNSDRRQCDRVE